MAFLDLPFHFKKEMEHKAGEKEPKVTREFFQQITKWFVCLFVCLFFLMWSTGRRCPWERSCHAGNLDLMVQLVV
jgi:hypothetical protein